MENDYQKHVDYHDSDVNDCEWCIAENEGDIIHKMECISCGEQATGWYINPNTNKATMRCEKCLEQAIKTEQRARKIIDSSRTVNYMDAGEYGSEEDY